MVQVAGVTTLHSENYGGDEDETEDLDLPLFTFKKIADATSDFSENSKLGEGGFGPVYKVIQAVLRNIGTHFMLQNVKLLHFMILRACLMTGQK